ncbi:putative hexose phosphate transport protein [Tetrabaena socialis]|uniref:Putative hexose phosphate transport protein n=1 Tax=Tetrabaena socialis TaxID=47790 RepID=A0A2J8ACF9_9CHLO|nr:putative hexose phosphate transport protein [Tetrabaena socialis]|eukprot:PNH10196.1 putative hexose phosphate transport protein [Tetrabaena socialis]
MILGAERAYGSAAATRRVRSSLRPPLVPAPRWALPRRVVRFFREEGRASSASDTNDGGEPSSSAAAPVVKLLPLEVVAAAAPGSPEDQHATSPSSLSPASPSSAAPASASTAVPASVPQPPGFTARRLFVFSGLVLGYAAYYLTRNSLTYTAPAMVADPALGFTLAQVGSLTSIFPIAYGMSKFVAGVVGDRFSPALLLGGGLLATAACNLGFGAGGGLTWFAAMWALNGLMQASARGGGVGAPSCARMLTAWFPTHERGTYWGLWNVAHNVGGFLSPLLAAGAAAALGWRWGMWAPGLAALALGAYALVACKDSPQAAGFNPVDPVAAVTVQHKQPGVQPAGLGSAHAHGAVSTAPSGAAAFALARAGAQEHGQQQQQPGELGRQGHEQHQQQQGKQGTQQQQQQQQGKEQQPGMLKMAMDNVLSNPYVWALSMTYFFVYVVRQVRPYRVFLVKCVPLSFIITRFGWASYFSALMAACGFALLLMVPMVGLSSFTQQQQQRREREAAAGEGSDGAPLRPELV